jgi:hypothetical protein
MPRKRSSTAATGGKGYTLADKAAAAFLVQMLARIFPLEPSLGLISEIHFETKESGRSLDDLLLLLQSGSGIARWPISVKSNQQLSRSGFDATFVQDAWAESRNEDVSKFDQNSDLLGLVTGVVGAARCPSKNKTIGRAVALGMISTKGRVSGRSARAVGLEP